MNHAWGQLDTVFDPVIERGAGHGCKSAKEYTEKFPIHRYHALALPICGSGGDSPKRSAPKWRKTTGLTSELPHASLTGMEHN